MIEPFEWNRQLNGGTEYMARNFRELILPHLPKLRDYLCLVIPGILPHFTDIHKENKELIVWMHNTPIQFGEGYLDSLRNPKFLNKVKYFIAVSEFSKQEIINQLNVEPERVYVIHNAIHPLKYDPSKFDNPKKIKLINTSSPDRGIDVLLNSILHIEEDFELDIFSRFNPNDYPEYTPDSRINFYGFSHKNAVIRHYEAAHIHAYPSTYPETFCLSQVEAMSAGLLCVTSDIGALPEVSSNHTNIYKFDADPMKHKDVFANQLLEAINKIKSGNWNPEEQIKYVNDNYSWEAIKQEWIKFHKLL